jgi:hypothetical protein
MNKTKTTLDFHELAKEGKLNTIDPALLTIENLTSEDYFGKTVMHIAGEHGNLNQFKPELLTEKTLLVNSGFGWTPLHTAAYNNHIEQIPQHILTEKNITLKDRDGEMPLHFIAKNQKLELIHYTLLVKVEIKAICLKHTRPEKYKKALKVTKEIYTQEILKKIKKSLKGKQK